MKALIYKGNGEIALGERPMPVLQDPRDVIVRVELASICSSDLHIKHGTVPRAKANTVLGHEFVGTVLEIGADVHKIYPGDRIAVNVESFCGECFYCKRGFVNNCENGGWELGCRIDGGQAEYARIPYADQALNPIPPTVSFEQALFVGDILATGYWAAQIAEIGTEDVVLCIGAGPTGLCTLMCARLHAPKAIVAVDINDDRLGLAKSAGLADFVVNPRRDDIQKLVNELTDGRGFDRVFEVAGTAGTFASAWQLARPNAIVVLAALYPDAQSLPLNQMYGKNLTFKTGGVDANSCPEILRLIESGKIDTSPLITHRAALNKIEEAYKIFENQEDACIKWAISPYEH